MCRFGDFDACSLAGVAMVPRQLAHGHGRSSAVSTSPASSGPM